MYIAGVSFIPVPAEKGSPRKWSKPRLVGRNSCRCPRLRDARPRPRHKQRERQGDRETEIYRQRETQTKKHRQRDRKTEREVRMPALLTSPARKRQGCDALPFSDAPAGRHSKGGAIAARLLIEPAVNCSARRRVHCVSAMYRLCTICMQALRRSSHIVA
eukprot:COSAG03_NODE_6002_length_1133_cov_1.354932_2_plen_160_part_00